MNTPKGPYVGSNVLTLDEKHRICLVKNSEKIKQRSPSGVLYFYACYEEEENPVRSIKVFDETYYSTYTGDLHPAALEEIRIQTNDRIQLPQNFYNFLGFNQEHKYVLMSTDKDGYFFYLYNLGAVTYGLDKQENLLHLKQTIFTNISPGGKQYLTLLALDNGSPREGYYWMMSELEKLKEKDMPSLNPNVNLPGISPSPQKNGKTWSSPTLPSLGHSTDQSIPYPKNPLSRNDG